MLILSLVGLFKVKLIAGVCRGFVCKTFGTSFWVKNVAWNSYNFVGFMSILLDLCRFWNHLSLHHHPPSTIQHPGLPWHQCPCGRDGVGGQAGCRIIFIYVYIYICGIDAYIYIYIYMCDHGPYNTIIY